MRVDTRFEHLQDVHKHTEIRTKDRSCRLEVQVTSTESPQQRRRLRKHTIREEGKEEDTSELTSKLDDDDDDSPLRMSDSPSLPKIGRKEGCSNRQETNSIRGRIVR